MSFYNILTSKLVHYVTGSAVFPPCRRGRRRDDRTVAEYLSDVVADAKAAGSNPNEARFQGYQVNPLLLIECLLIIVDRH